MANKYKPLYTEAVNTLGERDKRIEELQRQVNRLNDELNKEKDAHAQTVKEKDGEYAELEKEKNAFEEKIDSLDSALETTKTKLQSMELSRFASEFHREEGRCEKEQHQWFKYSVIATGVLVISALFTIFNTPSDKFLPNPEIIFLNAVLLTIFIYCLRQHTHLADLREDYANRKALAQSYQYMVEAEEGDGLDEIRAGFFEKAIEIFTKRPKARGRDVTWFQGVFSALLPGKHQ